jgi:hypothetical protein
LRCREAASANVRFLSDGRSLDGTCNAADQPARFDFEGELSFQTETRHFINGKFVSGIVRLPFTP